MDGQDIFMGTLGGLLLAIHACRVAGLTRWQEWQHLPWAVSNSAAKVCKWCAFQNLQTPIESAVEEAVRVNRLEHFRDFCAAARLLFATVVGFTFVARIAGRERLHTSIQDALIFLLYFQLMLADMYPQLLNVKTMNLWYSAIMLILCLYHAPLATTREYLPLANTYVLVIGGIASLGCLRPSLVIFWKAVSMGCAWASTRILAADDELQVRLLNVQMLMTVMICAWVVLSGDRWREQARKNIEAQLLMEKTSACRVLMKRFYDLVTELDAGMAITDSGRDLARFLECDTAASLEGTKFDELLIGEEEQELFRARMAQPTNEPEGVADSLHVSIRFGVGHVRQVELFSFEFPSIVGHRRLLIGIRDCDEHSLRQPADLPGSLDVALSRGVCGTGAISVRATLETFTVTVDSTRPNLPVLRCSTGCENLVALDSVTRGAEDVTLADCVSNIGQIEAWLQRVMSVYLDGEPEEVVQKANRCKVLLRSCPGILSAAQRDMTCKILFADRDDSSRDDMMAVQLEFSQRSRVGRTGSRRRRAGGSGSSSSSCGSDPGRGTPRSMPRRPLGQNMLSL